MSRTTTPYKAIAFARDTRPHALLRRHGVFGARLLSSAASDAGRAEPIDVGS